MSKVAMSQSAVSITADGTFVMFPAVMTVTNRAAIERVVTFVRVLNWLFLQAVDGAPIGATATVELSTEGYPPTSIPVRVQRRGMHTREPLVFRVTAHNRTSQEIGTESLHVGVIDEVGRRDHAKVAKVTDEKERPVSVIAPGALVKITVVADEPEALGKTVRFVLSGSAPVLPATRYFRVPSAGEWLENERRKERIEREAKRVSLHLVGSYGAIWLDDGIDGTDTLKPASLKGLGVRFTKGVTPMWALEAEIGGATSGTAEYGTVTVDGTEGELTRSAKLGRVQFGGLLRLGDKIVPHARLGVALQVVSQDASMMTTGGEMTGPESGIEVAGGVYGGAGVDFKLGSNLVAGMGLSYTAAQSDQRILDFSLCLRRYQWDRR